MSDESGTALLNLVIREWTEIDLKSLQGWLDSEAVLLHDGRQRIKDSREGLLQKNKQWKELPKKERLKSIGGVMKMYQKHIDDLMSRVEENEAVFLKIYSTLGTAADPLNALQSASTELRKKGNAMQELEETKRDFGRMKDEFSGLVNQSLTIRELEEQIKELSGSVQADISAGIEEARGQLEEEKEKVVADSKERERELKMQNQFLKGELAQIQKRLNEAQAELLDHSLKKDQSRALKDTDRQVLEEDIELLNAQVVSLMKENKELQAEVTVLQDNTVNITQLEILEEKVQYAESRARNAEASLESQAMANSEILKDRDRAVAELEKKVLDLREEVSENQALVPATPFFDQTAILKKSKEVEQRCHKLKLELEKSRTHQDHLAEDLKQRQDELNEQRALVAKLEEDLSKQYSDRPRAGQAPRGLEEVMGEPTETNPFTVVCKQRDRFKNKNHQLEQNVSALNVKLEKALTEKSVLYRENGQLFKKIRFLESYNSQSPSNDNRVKRRNIELSAVEAKYRDVYLESTNPWTDFEKRVQSQREKALSPWEKITLQVSSFVLSRTSFRKCTFFYAITLHLLVFFSIYYRSHSTLNCPNSEHEHVGLDLASTMVLQPDEQISRSIADEID